VKGLKSTTYLTENTITFHYKDQPVTAAQENNGYLWRQSYWYKVSECELCWHIQWPPNL